MEIRKYAVKLYGITSVEREKVISILTYHDERIYPQSKLLKKEFKFSSRSAAIRFIRGEWSVTVLGDYRNISLLTPAKFIEKFGKQSLKEFYGD